MARFHVLAIAALCSLLLSAPAVTAQKQPDPPKPAAIQDADQQAIEKDRALKRKIRVWEATLSEIAKRENATMFVDAPLNLDPPTIAYDRPYGTDAMKALANSCDREWKQAAGIQTFARTVTRISHAQVTAALNWLSQMPDDEFSRLFAGKVALSDLEPPAQDLMLGLAGWEPDMTFALLGKSDITQVQLTIEPRFRYTDPKTGETRQTTIPSSAKRAPLPAKAAANSAPTLKPLDKPSGGTLKFGKGEILTLAEVAKRAGDVFHMTYIVDMRIGENRYFVSGAYNKNDFEKALGNVTTVPPVHIKEVTPDRAGYLALLRDRIMRLGPGNIDVSNTRSGIRFSGSVEIEQFNQKHGATEELKATDFMNGKQITAGNLCNGMPGMSLFMQGLGIGPDTMLTLDAGYGLTFEAPGFHILSHGSTSINGVAVTPMAPNQTGSGLQ